MTSLIADKFTPARLPSGSFTMDRRGEILVSTIPSSYPRKQITEIGRHAVEVFRSAEKADLPLAEMVIDFSSLKVVAKELRGGVIVYLKPVSME